MKNRSYFDFYSLDPFDYALHGGAFPIAIKGSVVIGVITVSGLAQEEDHGLIVEAFTKFLTKSSQL